MRILDINIGINISTNIHTSVVLNLYNKRNVLVQLMKRSIQIERAVYNIVKNSNIPISTREISLRINRAWHTIDRHCLKLQLKDKITGFRIGNINAWILKK